MVDAGDVDGGGVADGELVVAGGEPAVVFEVVEAALDGVSVLVLCGVEGWRSAADGAASYSARIRALYSAVNTRRLGRSARGPMTPSSTAPSAKVIVIGCYSLLTPCKGRNSVVVSHHSLTHRVANLAVRGGTGRSAHADSRRIRK